MKVLQENSWKIKILYDGECPLCVQEIRFLEKRDAGRGLVKFVDICDENYNPHEHQNIDFSTAMGKIHGILPDGTILTSIDVFQKTYELLGMGWVYALAKIKFFRYIGNCFYGIWAKYRFFLTGRKSYNHVILEHQKKLKSLECKGRCDIKSK